MLTLCAAFILCFPHFFFSCVPYLLVRPSFLFALLLKDTTSKAYSYLLKVKGQQEDLKREVCYPFFLRGKISDFTLIKKRGSFYFFLRSE
jgi:hypothetical protein